MPSELEGALRPFEGPSIAFSGTYLDGTYKRFFADDGATDLTGNWVQRQPKWQWRVSPSCEARFGSNVATLYTTVAYTGDRFSDVQNQQTLPNFIKWDAGVIVEVDKRNQFQASGDNISDTIGLTEGTHARLDHRGRGQSSHGRSSVARSGSASATSSSGRVRLLGAIGRPQDAPELLLRRGGTTGPGACRNWLP